ncbi:MAG: DciA family protein [Woeseia sp.]
MTIIRLDKLLTSSSSGRLDKIIRRARQNQDLTDLIKSNLDKDLAEAVISTTVQKDELVVVAASSAWAARLRFEAETLLRAARAHVPEVARCQVRVARQESVRPLTQA